MPAPQDAAMRHLALSAALVLVAACGSSVEPQEHHASGSTGTSSGAGGEGSGSGGTGTGGSFGPVAAMSTARQLTTALRGDDGRVRVFGGLSMTVIGSVEAYDPETNTWTTGASGVKRYG